MDEASVGMAVFFFLLIVGFIVGSFFVPELFGISKNGATTTDAQSDQKKDAHE